MERICRVTAGAGATFELGKRLAGKLAGSENLMLCGELGAGKTTFIQGMGKELGVKEKIISPTYQLIKTYGRKEPVLTHVDLYRLSKTEEVYGLDWPEILNPETVTVIEWADRVEQLWPEGAIVVRIKVKSKTERKIKIFEKG
ncbi:MAG: tRNA (adenosine(37)-N6)-threonylcarbamoyltransferase complex ATPase subunit type 1 TsaE [Elusimicrobiota bacterium]